MRTTYSDPTANMAIANILREEREKERRRREMERKDREQAGQVRRKEGNKRRESA